MVSPQCLLGSQTILGSISALGSLWLKLSILWPHFVEFYGRYGLVYQTIAKDSVHISGASCLHSSLLCSSLPWAVHLRILIFQFLPHQLNETFSSIWFFSPCNMEIAPMRKVWVISWFILFPFLKGQQSWATFFSMSRNSFCFIHFVQFSSCLQCVGKSKSCYCVMPRRGSADLPCLKMGVPDKYLLTWKYHKSKMYLIPLNYYTT